MQLFLEKECRDSNTALKEYLGWVYGFVTEYQPGIYEDLRFILSTTNILNSSVHLQLQCTQKEAEGLQAQGQPLLCVEALSK